MNAVGKVFAFAFFLEEFIQWQPGEIRTIFENFAKIVANDNGVDFQNTANYPNLLLLINPAVCFFLLAISLNPMTEYIKSIFNQKARSDIIIWLERNSYIRVLLAAFVAVYVILQLQSILDNTANTFISLYQNKALVKVIFTSMIITSFLNKKGW